ncbi:MAG TPA: cytochrome c peroxidase [Methylocella sp.]|nr:cytochrome c peroxidase [Methylocella sp.]
MRRYARRLRNPSVRSAAAAAITAALAVLFPQAAGAVKPALTEAEFELIRQALQADLKRTPPGATPAAAAQNRLESLLGEKLFSDKNLSLRRNQSCASCHQLTPAIDPKTGLPFPAPGFVDAENVEHGTPVSKGSVPGRSGRLNAPSAAYAAFSPPFHWDKAEELYVGGQFWNGRASTLADQAAQPFLNPAEMAMPGKAAVVERLKENPSYRLLFWKVYKLKIARALSSAEINAVYNAMTEAISAFERTPPFRKFTSKFDYFMAGKIELTPLERRGLNLFNNKAKCAACHISTPAKNPDGTWTPALFTDFTYDNIGVPRNLNIPGNPEPDEGLGGRPDIAAADPQGLEIGKHKVMTLRNIAITPPYGHNGVFTSLEQIMHFYNTRDTLGRVPDNHHPGFGITGWPTPEVPLNVNADELGNLGLSPEEESAVVAFMKTLTDGYPLWGGDPGVPPGSPAPYGP